MVSSTNLRERIESINVMAEFNNLIDLLGIYERELKVSVAFTVPDHNFC